MTGYLDYDYDSLPSVDLDLHLHWIQLPIAVWEKKQAAKREALHQARLAEYPDHKIILVPADPSYSPTEQELWPLVTHTVLECLKPHPEFRAEVSAAVYDAITGHRGWRNPYPVNFDSFEPPRKK